MPGPRPQRFVTLDGMRGLAALAVAAFHFDKSLASSGYLAVDFFFGLSGFVLAHAYEKRLTLEMSTFRFMEMRAVRLYPVFLAGILIGASYTIQSTIKGGNTDLTYIGALRATGLGALMLPDPFSENLYPLNTVFWSIATELAVNLLFATVLFRLKTIKLYGVVLISGTCTALLASMQGNLDLGVSWSTIDGGLARTIFSFALGAIIARSHDGARRCSMIITTLLIGTLGAVLLFHPNPSFRLSYDLVAIVAVFPILLWFGARVDPSGYIARIATFLGDVSYALYATHKPIASAMTFVAHRTQLPTAVSLTLYLSIAIVVASALARFWDKPARRWLNHRLHVRRSAMPTSL